MLISNLGGTCGFGSFMLQVVEGFLVEIGTAICCYFKIIFSNNQVDVIREPNLGFKSIINFSPPDGSNS